MGEQATRRSKDEIDEKYDLSGSAYVLVLHHDKFSDTNRNRPGSRADMGKIHDVLGRYRTEPDGGLEVHENLPLRQVEQVMHDVSRKDFGRSSCLIVIIMSHGDHDDTIVAHDGGKYFLTQGVLEKVAENRTLAGKPKLYIVNACRGVQSVARRVVGVPSDDTVMFQSTFEGHVSYRNTVSGSFFVQEFFNLLRENDHLHICELSTLLNKRAEAEQDHIQNPTMTSTLRNRLIFRDLRKKRN